MSAPLLDTDGGSLLIALTIGVAFGWTLERAGLGSARKLMGQFYLTDFTVFKVMFSAIVTAMLGTFWLAWLGVLDLSRVYVPETYLPPQIAGGLVFGIGFALAGLCPGTSCVAAATGRGDGIAVGAGMLSGVLATGLAFAPLQHFYESGSRGTYTLPRLLNAPTGVVVFGVVAVALAGFWIAGKIERRSLAAGSFRRQPGILSATAIVLGGLALFVGDSGATGVNTDGRLSAIDLASWIKDRRPDLRIIDLRSQQEFEDFHIPMSSRSSVDGLANTGAARTDTIAVYSDTPAHARAAWKSLRALGYQHVYYVSGGAGEWLDEVMNPVLPWGAPADVRAAFEKTRQISLYFGGMPRIGADAAGQSPASRPVRKRGC